MRRIYVFAAGNERGGAASHMVTLCQAIRDADMLQQFRFVMVGNGYLFSRLHDVAGDSVIALPFHPIKAVMGLRRVLRDAPEPSLVHAHGPRINVLARVACGRRTPWTSTIHSHVFKDFLSSRLKSLVIPRLNLMCLGSAAGLFIVNPSFADFLPKRPMVLVPNSIPMTPLVKPKSDYEADLRGKLGIPANTPVVGIAARFDPVKDIRTLIHAIHRLRRKDVHLVIAGDGAEREPIEQLIRGLDLEAQVHLLGFLNDMDGFYAGLTAHVLCSRSEGLPTSLLEAGLAGVPNVGSDIAGITRLISDGQNGLCFPVGDAEALARQLERLIDNPELAQRLVHRFQTDVLPNYTPDAMLSAYLNGYHQFAGDQGVLNATR